MRFESSGFRTAQAHNGFQALDKAFAVAPDLIVADIAIPGVDGIELCRRLRADARTRAIPVIILTGSQRSQEILESKRLGAEFYIVKPVDFHRFCEVTPRLSYYWRLFRRNAQLVTLNK